jgi:hypothetical protein
MNRKSLHAVVLLSTYLFAQCTTRLPPTSSYCYLCCACVGIGVLKIVDENRFEIEYEERYKKQDRIVIGRGTYTQQKRLLTLHFEDIPVVAPEIRLEKIGDDNKVVIEVVRVIDPAAPDSAGSALLVVRKANDKKVYKEMWVDQAREAGSPPVTEDFTLEYQPTSLDPADWLLEVSFMNRNKTQISFPGPGRYRAEIIMPSEYADARLSSNDSQTFSVTRYPGEIVIRQKENRKIFFTTESCGCD